MTSITNFMKDAFYEVWTAHWLAYGAAWAVADRMKEELDGGVLYQLDELMIKHLDLSLWAEEVVRDLCGLPGVQPIRLTQTQLATAAAWTRLRELHDPPAILGAVYPGDAMTPVLCRLLAEVIEEKGLIDQLPKSVRKLARVEIMAPDVAGQVIHAVLRQHPDWRQSICFGFDQIIEVFPLPVWTAAACGPTSDAFTLEKPLAIGADQSGNG